MRLTPIALAALLTVACGSITTSGGTGGQAGQASGQGGTGARGGGSGKGGGSGGTAGTGGGATCAQLQNDYDTALAQARSCSPGANNQCQQNAPSSLACGCETFVNDTSTLDAIRSRWNQANCQNQTVCPAAACLQPRSSSCRPADGGGSACVDSLI